MGSPEEQIEINLIVIDPNNFPGLPAGELPEVTPQVLFEHIDNQTILKRDLKKLL